MTHARIKELVCIYKRQMFDFSNGYAEILQPLTLLKDIAIISIPLDFLGIKPSLLQYAIMFVFGFAGLTIFGKILRKTGILKFSTFLANEQNEMLTKIEEIVATKLR